MDLMNWAYLDQSLRLLNLNYLRLTGINVCRCHPGLLLEVGPDVPPHYVSILSRGDYPVLSFTAVLTLKPLWTALSNLIEYGLLSAFHKIVILGKQLVYLSLSDEFLLCVDVVVVKFNLTYERPVSHSPKHRLEVLLNAIYHKRIVLISYG
jgi:hypothetical protein